MSDNSLSRTQDFDPNRSRWIPWVFVGGMTVVILVNIVLVYAALSTFTGVYTSRSYDRGRTYNQVIAEAARQDALGWTTRVVLEGGVLSLVATDREGLPVGGRVEGVLHRPLEGSEVPLDFAAAGHGRFIALAELPAAGQWEARLTLFGPQDGRLEIRQRLLVR
jgi:nitrogen fixation protein FixH